MNHVSDKARAIFESIVIGSDTASQLEGVSFESSEIEDEVKCLLRWHQEAGSFLEYPLGEQDFAVAGRQVRSGDLLQHYKLSRLLGAGGFGFVFEAEQTSPVKRRVAIKVIKPGMDTSEVVKRFKFELETLSLLDHPNIARILDAGSDDRGRPFFVMDLVDGCDIATYFNRQPVSTPDLLKVFVEVCRAVQFAHQKGVIHRDLKASNILVEERDGVPVPRVIDFGIAKSIEGFSGSTTSEVTTRSFSLLGTPPLHEPGTGSEKSGY